MFARNEIDILLQLVREEMDKLTETDKTRHRLDVLGNIEGKLIVMQPVANLGGGELLQAVIASLAGKEARQDGCN